MLCIQPRYTIGESIKIFISLRQFIGEWEGMLGRGGVGRVVAKLWASVVCVVLILLCHSDQIKRCF